MGDIFGRGIRYGILPENEKHREAILLYQQSSTDGIAQAERTLDGMHQAHRKQELLNLEIEAEFGSHIPPETRTSIEEARAAFSNFQTERITREAELKRSFDENRRVLRSLKRKGDT
jgi:hypothetical protein